jgi:hypothetical protein
MRVVMMGAPAKRIARIGISLARFYKFGILKQLPFLKQSSNSINHFISSARRFAVKLNAESHAQPDGYKPISAIQALSPRSS